MTGTGEIVAVLTDQPGVTDAVVLVREDVVPGEAVLVAYVVSPLLAEDLALGEALRRRLPPRLLPAAVVVMPELPLTRAGKLDRAALPVPRLVSPVDTACTTPSPW